jgi:exosortase/archaeosortase family protein
MIPVAIVSNGTRVLGSALLTYYWGERMAEGFFHMFSGWVIFMVATLLLLTVHASLLSVRRAVCRATAT